MAAFILIGLLIALLKRYRLRPLLRAWDIYPLLAVELCYVALQLHTFFGAYSVIKYAGLLQIMFILSYIFPVVRRSLYRPAFAGAALTALGSLLNRLAINANGGKMPVYATLSRLTGYYKEGAMQNFDSLHTVMDASTRLPFLCDFIDTGFSVMSVGDLMLHAFAAIVVFYTVKALNTPAINISEPDVK